MNPLQKRNNPFDRKINPEPTKPVVEEEEFEDEEVEEVVVTPKRTQPAPKKVIKEVEVSADRDKYTSTMDRKLRRQIKIVCAERGLLFASFVEEACKEKLRREGVL